MTCLRKCYNKTVKAKIQEIKSSLDNLLLKVLTYLRNIRKAMTEKSSLQEPSRENGSWWKPFMRKADENHSRAVKPKAAAKALLQRNEKPKMRWLLSVTVSLR